MEQGHPLAALTLGNPLHAGLQLLTDVLSRIPGPHQRRISSRQPVDSDSLAWQVKASLPSLNSAPLRGPQIGHSTARTTGHGAEALTVSAPSGMDSSSAGRPVTREELGRATWTLLHTLAAQYPEKPTKQQRRDAKQLVDVLTRIYPCAECAHHFEEIIRHDPPTVGNRRELELWMCQVHNAVNRSLGKPSFRCDMVSSRWSSMDCGEDNACDLTIGKPRR